MKVVLATGGSGGHIFPALKTADLLRAQGHEVFLTGALKSVEQRLKNSGINYRLLDVEGFNVRSLPRFFTRMIQAVKESKEYLRHLVPDVVVGFGSYSSFPVLWAAKRQKIPTMIHEQNVIPGKANRLAAVFVDRIAVSFDETRGVFGKGKTVWTGCPCNDLTPKESKAEILRAYGLQENRLTLLVLGGSQGSKYLNDVVFEALPVLGDVQVIHMTGISDEHLYAQKYPSLGLPFHVRSFLENVERAYAAADLVIARAGAATVCELASFGLPSVLVPYPFAHSHQKANALVLQKAGVALVIDQKDMNRQALVDAVHQMTGQGITPAVARQRLEGRFLKNPTEQLVRAIVSLKT